MSNTVLTMDAANMFVGASPTDSNASLNLKITEVKLPAFDEGYVDHRALGAPLAIEINTIFNRLESSFQILGIDISVYTKLAPIQDIDQWFFIYGLLKDKLTGEQSQASAVMKGRLSRVDPQLYRRNDTLHTNFAIRGITQYDLTVAGTPIYRWDFFANSLIVGTNHVTALSNQLLNIPNIAPQVPPAGPIAGTVVSP